MSSKLFSLRLRLIRRFMGEAAYDEACVAKACRNLAKVMESRAYPGYIAKRKIARYLDLPVSYVGEVAESLRIRHAVMNRTLYYKVRDAVTVLMHLR